MGSAVEDTRPRHPPHVPGTRSESEVVMMNRQQLAMIWDHLRQMHGITLRLIQNLPADQLDAHPIPKMRTPKELVLHLYGQNVKEVTLSLVSGEIKEYDETVAACLL